MTRFELETWDAGQLTVNAAFADSFRHQGWTTFDAIWNETAHAAVAKQLRTDRVTLRFELDAAFYIKRHTQSSWWEHVKPYLHGGRPCLGARGEWQALLDFHAAGLPTMTPVMLGESDSASFLITAALENCTKLSDWMADSEAQVPAVRHSIGRQLGELARRMHAAGMHHQDFYLGHLLRPAAEPATIHIIDLGRVQHHGPWFARRWIVKDLAQLNFSSQSASRSERLRFLEAYLGRKVSERDKPLVRSILRKTARIARHSRKNGL